MKTESYTVCKVLAGHVSPETAYIVNDYPYGFRLRCKIRYWVEFNAKKGARFFSQTTNPKKPGDPWNTPKASTFSKFGGALFINDIGHVCWDGVNEYSTIEDLVSWLDYFRPGVPAEFLASVFLPWLRAKIKHDEKRALGAVSYVTTTNGVEGERHVMQPELSVGRRAELFNLYVAPALLMTGVGIVQAPVTADNSAPASEGGVL